MVELRLPNKTVDEFVSAVKQIAATLSRYDDSEDVHLWVTPIVVRGAGGRIVRVDLDVTESTFWRVEREGDEQVQVTRETGRTWFLARSDGETLHIEGGHSGPSRLSILAKVLRALPDRSPEIAYNVALLRAWLDATEEELRTDVPPAEVVQAAEAGRRADAAYDWAWAELLRGRTQDEVYEEWRRRPDVADRWQQMEDPREAFRSAMKRRKQGRTKPT